MTGEGTSVRPRVKSLRWLLVASAGDVGRIRHGLGPTADHVPADRAIVVRAVVADVDALEAGVVGAVVTATHPVVVPAVVVDAVAAGRGLRTVGQVVGLATGTVPILLLVDVVAVAVRGLRALGQVVGLATGAVPILLLVDGVTVGAGDLGAVWRVVGLATGAVTILHLVDVVAVVVRGLRTVGRVVALAVGTVLILVGVVCHVVTAVDRGLRTVVVGGRVAAAALDDGVVHLQFHVTGTSVGTPLGLGGAVGGSDVLGIALLAEGQDASDDEGTQSDRTAADDQILLHEKGSPSSSRGSSAGFSVSSMEVMM